MPAVELDEELSKGSHQERQPHPGAGEGVGEGQACPAALGRHHRGRLVQAGEPHPCEKVGNENSVPKKGLLLSGFCVPLSQTRGPWLCSVPGLKGGDFCCGSQGSVRFGGWGLVSGGLEALPLCKGF